MDYEFLLSWLREVVEHGDDEPQGYITNCCGDCEVCAQAIEAIEDLQNRLAAYKDTGLEPEDVKRMMANYDTAITRMTGYRELVERRAPPCYSPDTGGGCRYQIYSDCDDEPIDKCKRCPLCYADKHRHQPEPNAPLTLEELREMLDSESGGHIWVREIYSSATVPAIVDSMLNTGICAVYSAGPVEYVERDYDKFWVAYRYKPSEG